MSRGRLYLLIGLLLVLTLGAALAWGTVSIPAREILHALGHRLGLTPAPTSPVYETILWDLRLPRVLMAFLTGAGLSLVGVLMQALVRNPLAEPYVLGLSSGASLGAALFFLGFLPPLISRWLSLPLAAFLGAFLTLLTVLALGRANGSLSPARLLLAGVALSAFLGAFTSFLTFASPYPDKLRAMLFWLLGSFHLARWSMVPIAGGVVLLGGLLARLYAPALDAMLFGEETAHHLGFPVERVKKHILLASALVTGTLVAFTGVIGFVGLIIPHTARMIVGPTHRRVLPLSLLLGGWLLTGTDLASRSLLAGQEIPVGIFTALLGVPFFLFLLRRAGTEIF